MQRKVRMGKGNGTADSRKEPLIQCYFNRDLNKARDRATWI